MSIEREEVLVADNATNFEVAETAINSISTREDELTRVNALKKHPYNYHMKQGAKSGLIWNQPVRKNILSHNQVICLIQHALDPADVPLFVTSLETIKLSNGQFPNMVPMSVDIDIFDKFCCSTKESTRVDVVDMCDSDHVKVSQIASKDVGKAKVNPNEINHFQTLGKTPIWAIAHCLDRIVSDRKRYTLVHSSFEELGLASDHAFLVEGIMNVKNTPEEISERNKHIPCGPKMNYVKDVKGDSDEVHISVILYIPSIGRFFLRMSLRKHLDWMHLL